MTIIKVTKSGKGILVVDDSGSVYSTSRIAIENLLAGNIRNGFVLLSKLPFSIPEGKFKKSELYVPPGYIAPKEGDDVMDKDYFVRRKKIRLICKR